MRSMRPREPSRLGQLGSERAYSSRSSSAELPPLLPAASERGSHRLPSAARSCPPSASPCVRRKRVSSCAKSRSSRCSRAASANPPTGASVDWVAPRSSSSSSSWQASFTAAESPALCRCGAASSATASATMPSTPWKAAARNCACATAPPWLTGCGACRLKQTSALSTSCQRLVRYRLCITCATSENNELPTRAGTLAALPAKGSCLESTMARSTDCSTAASAWVS
mmetsp:Transcript_4100/g.9196  ORF Transcript_4100/g.9196 Transcript_4100/m.9196 type:complete len:227 (+) Transcript_4100:444-1124(+)